MRKRLYNILWLIGALVVTACSGGGSDAKDDVTISSERIELNPSTVEFSSAKGVQQTIRLSANCKWNITNIPNWLIVNPKEGSGDATLTLETATENTGNERSEQLKVSGLERSVTLTVRQRGDGVTPTPTQVTLTVDPSTLSFAYNETSARTISATVSPATATISVQSSNTALCTASVSGSGSTRTITVTPKANSTNSQRTATITVTASANGETATKTISVTQEPAPAGSAPVISAFSITGATSSSFTFSMTFTSNPASTNYGVCYSSTTSSPTLDNSAYTYWQNSTTGTTLNGTVNHDVLVAGTKYYVRAFAQNSYGTTYSSNTLTVTLQPDSPNAPGEGDNPVPNVPARGM